MVNRTEGPGARMIKTVAIKYSHRREGIASAVNTR
jgi:predicted GNAT family acetyltransferase